jgi:type IV pilus assembly protein PilB
MRHNDARVQDEIIDALLERGVLTHDNLKRARTVAEQDENEPVLFHLLRMGIVSPDVATRLLAEYFGCEGVDLATVDIDDKVVHSIEAELAISHRVLPIGRDGPRLRLAMANPRDVEASEAVSFITGRVVVPVVADAYSLAARIDRSYNRTGEQIDKALMEFHGSSSEIEVADVLAEVQEAVAEAPIVKLIYATLHEAVKRKASDIHIEPINRNEMRIRFRIDGQLTERGRMPLKMRDAIVSRVKIMSEMNIAERRKSQDGRISREIDGRVVDFRVNTLPSSFGEKIVLRILDKSQVSLDLEMLGIDERGLDIIRSTLASPVGMIIATGPTGAGKTTTLYSMLLKLDAHARNIISAEDPVEYDLDYITQVPVSAEHGRDFSDILRAALRQDPDVIMVGEMRDLPTMQIAIRAALTGHTVLSTLHTNDAAGAFTRMMDMGAERFNVGTAVSTVIAQRLVRRVCAKCTAPFRYTDDYMKLAQVPEELWANATFQRGEGCQACENRGYIGRVGLYEVLAVSPAIRDLIMAADGTAPAIKALARREGMKTLREIGVERSLAGLTTLEEVVANTQAD